MNCKIRTAVAQACNSMSLMCKLCTYATKNTGNNNLNKNLILQKRIKH